MLVRATKREENEVNPMHERAVDVAHVSIVDCTLREGPRDVLEYALVATEGRS